MEWLSILDNVNCIVLNRNELSIFILVLVSSFFISYRLYKKNIYKKAAKLVIVFLIVFSYVLTLSQVMEYNGDLDIYILRGFNLFIYIVLSVFGVFVYSEISKEESEKESFSEEIHIECIKDKKATIKYNQKYVDNIKSNDNLKEKENKKGESNEKI